MTKHTPPRVNTERVRKRLKGLGMGFALMQKSDEERGDIDGT